MTDGRVTRVGYTVDDYFGLVHSGALRADDRVELLDGVIVAEPPMDPPHATGIALVARALGRAVGEHAAIRIQSPLIASPFSAPEPDVAVVPGALIDYAQHHPTTALLVVEVAASSLPQDRLSKSRIYAGAGVPDFWIVNLRDACVEVHRRPDLERRLYAERHIVRRGDRLRLLAPPGASVAVAELLPPGP